IARWQKLVTDPDPPVREKALEVLAAQAPATSVPLFVQHLPNAGYAVQQLLIDALTKAAATQPPQFADQLLPLVASGDAGTRTAVMKILLGMPNPAEIVKRYVRFTKTLAGFMRDRALESIRAFGSQVVEPTIELLSDPDEDIRAAAIAVASTFEDPRLVPATIMLLKDPDWWIRISAAEALGRMKDPRAVEALVAALADPDVKWTAVEALGHIAEPRSPNALGRMLADPQWDALQKHQPIDFTYFIPQAGRYRANIFVDQKGYNAVFRVIPEKPPTMLELGLPPQLAEIAGYHQGLVLICGPSGSGK